MMLLDPDTTPIDMFYITECAIPTAHMERAFEIRKNMPEPVEELIHA